MFSVGLNQRFEPPAPPQPYLCITRDFIESGCAQNGWGLAAWSRDALPRAARRVAPPATLDIFSHHRLALRPGDSLSIWVLLRMCNCPISTGLAEHADAIDLAAVREHGHHGGHPTGACAGVGRGDLKGFAGTRCVEALLSEMNAQKDFQSQASLSAVLL